MIIYNVTCNVHETIHDEWVKWMRSEHIPAMLDTGKFHKALMTKVLVKEPMGGITYSIQYTAQNKQLLERYYRENASELREQAARFGDKVVSFRTELEVISEQ
ncbi:MAG: DUF4286 family protein [Bacteroidota bacterium]|nr:hypothetical protein [Christiangramia sp.]MEE2773129.1 DUF4286 family protein [Bacteroidota bacterium]